MARLAMAASGAGLVGSPATPPAATALPARRGHAPSDVASRIRQEEVAVGEFILTLGRDGDDGPTLRIAHRSDPSRLIWASLDDGGFLVAAVGRAEVRENTAPFSGFDIRDTTLVRCDRQTVDAVEADGDGVTLSGTLSGAGTSVGYAMTWTAVTTDQLRFAIELSGPDAVEFNRLVLRYASAPEEHFFGFGQQLTFFDQKGRVLPILVQEHGVGRGRPLVSQLVALRFGRGTVGSWSATEVSVPHYVTNLGRSLCLETSDYAVFDLSHNDRVELTLFAGAMSGRVFHGRTPLELIEAYTGYAGRMRPLPDWIHDGVVVAVQGGTDRALAKLDELVRADVPVAAFWIQDWVGQRTTPAGKQLWWDWQLDEEHYPDWGGLVAALRERRSARIMVYVNPFLANQPGHDRLYQEALRSDYLVKNRQGEPYSIRNAGFAAGLIDLSNPVAREWIKEVITREMIGRAGASGWMADFGEALPLDAVLASGEDAAAWHNRYPEEWARVNRKAIEEAGLGDDAVFFTRSGYTRSPGLTTLCWLGDQLQSWDGFDGIKTAVVGALSGSISGFGLVHSDTGGYDSISFPLPGDRKLPLVARSKELLLRWMELAAFSPVFRTHEGVDPTVAWQFDGDAETMAQLKRCVEIYRAWGFYRKELVAETARTGHPVMRHPILHHPDDPATLDLRYQYLLGSELMVAPVLDPGAERVAAYLPAGGWTHLWTGDDQGVAAGWAEVEAPIGRPAVFARRGSAIGAEFLAALQAAGID